MRYPGPRNVMFRLATLAVALCFVLLTQSRSTGQGGRPCDADIERFCENVQVYGGWTATCLELHMQELTPPCRDRMENMIGQAEAVVGEVCQDDIRSLCFGVESGDGRITECLEANFHKLSLGCRNTLYEAGAGMR